MDISDSEDEGQPHHSWSPRKPVEKLDVSDSEDEGPSHHSWSPHEPVEKLDVSMSPLKDKEDVTLFNGNPRCKIVKLDSLENLHFVPILMNGRDTPNIISTSVPTRCQEDASLIIDLDALDSREDIYCDDNGVWVATGCKS